MEIQANVDRGLSPDEARIAAQRRFGSTLLVREAARQADPAFHLDIRGKDVRYAARSPLRAPGFTVAACATLALAIGASAAIFTVTYRVLLNPLPYPDSAHILMLDFGNPTANVPSGFRSISSQQYFQYLDRARSLSSRAVYTTDDLTISGRGTPERIRVSRVTPSLVSVLGVSPPWAAGSRRMTPLPGPRQWQSSRTGSGCPGMEVIPLSWGDPWIWTAEAA